ncbi:EAL domain-containing protein [Bacillus sp. 31A1R]|uniref:EAL domain-containing protein n=1 Tax=Robertmurraya mangrovi TaxID=3098077 RepID=A0ABU5ITY6_9BACI|nr:EAL domain-containing protein [Bacillus sp. 31A1R]MDZ5470593.1 EAL domain-containing protein [Bacillus sp. 31A1R]
MDHLKGIIAAEINNELTERKIEKVIFNIVFNHIKDMIFIMKVEEGPIFTYIFANDTGSKYAGLTADSIGKGIEEVLPYERAFSLQKIYESVLVTRKTKTFSDEIELPDGRVSYTESILTPVIDQNNQVRFVVSVTRDVTETVMERKRLILTEQRYRSIVDHNLDGVFVVSLDGKILEVNPAGQKLSGYTEKQMTYRSIYDLIADQDHHDFKELFQKTITGLALESLDCRFVHSKGHTLAAHIKTVPIVIHSEIQGIYMITRDISEQASNIETIKYMAFHDQLTGLFNRRALLSDLENQIKLGKNSNETFALLSIDLDRFKHINDSLGHLAGDQILTKVADRLSELKSDHLKVYRQGGDEFIILLQGNRNDASQLSQSILSKFAKSFYLDSNEYYITPSIGISLYPNDGRDAETLIKNADEALFRVKEKGKAHFQFYRSEMNSLISNLVSLETRLRKAIERKELILHYQPQVDLKTGNIESFEALIRWDSKELGLISPGDFIPLAEDTGLIIPIGNWVIEQACKKIKEWGIQFQRDFRIAINISPKQFHQPNLVKTIKKCIKKYHITPSLLEIEITEGAMQDTSETIPILKGLKELGVTISIDDFGTGYSSLNYLKQFPIDVLKIDQSFVSDLHINAKDAAITTTIIHLADSLGLEVVAEGIEKKEQVEFLLKANCHKGQGYYFSRPVSEKEIKEKLLY